MESINWKNYFDHLYSLTWPGNKEQIPILQKELDRVNILNSGIYSNFINIRTPFHKDIFDKVQKIIIGYVIIVDFLCLMGIIILLKKHMIWDMNILVLLKMILDS